MKLLKDFSEEGAVPLKELAAGDTVRIEKTGAVCILTGFIPGKGEKKQCARAVNLETGEDVLYGPEEKARPVTLELKRPDIVRFSELKIGERFSTMSLTVFEYIKTEIGEGAVGAVDLLTGEVIFPDLNLLVLHNDEPVPVRFRECSGK